MWSISLLITSHFTFEFFISPLDIAKDIHKLLQLSLSNEMHLLQDVKMKQKNFTHNVTLVPTAAGS